MSLDRTLAVTARVLRQLRRDHRSIAMIILVPCLLLWMLQITFQNVPGVYNSISSMLLGAFPFIMIFLVTSITMLRERNLGTLDRMLVSPIGRADIMVGYAIAFSLLAAFQSAIAMFVAVVLLDAPSNGNVGSTFLIVLLIAVYGTALGLTLSAFARTEFQAVQFMPMFLLPQIFLSGLLVQVDQMPDVLGWIATVNPLQYSFALLTNVMRNGESLVDSDNQMKLLVAVLVPMAVLLFGATTMQRQRDS